MPTGRVLYISDEKYTHHDGGAYGDIFVDESEKKCWKVFKNKGECNSPSDSYDSETEAYELAQNNPQIKNLVPTLYRKALNGLKIIDDSGNDVSSEYIVNLNYEMDFLNLAFQKIGTFTLEETKTISQDFRDAGIGYIDDASMAYDNKDKPKLIDFGVKPISLSHKHY